MGWYTCPKCSSTLITVDGGDRHCLACGHRWSFGRRDVVLADEPTPDPRDARIAELEADLAFRNARQQGTDLAFMDVMGRLRAAEEQVAKRERDERAAQVSRAGDIVDEIEDHYLAAAEDDPAAHANGRAALAELRGLLWKLGGTV